jgi:hypothetical protein
MLATLPEAHELTQSINSLREPYRRNAIEWLEACSQRSLQDLSQDLGAFLADLHPIVRESFVAFSRQLFDDARRYFGSC